VSVILECKQGDSFYCLQRFNASPDGRPFSWNNCRQFKIGERLEYVGYKKDANLSHQPNGWLVVFRAGDDTLFSAAQTYFVTEECWRGLEKFFRSEFTKSAKQVQTGRFGLAHAAKHTIRRLPTKKSTNRKHAALKK